MIWVALVAVALGAALAQGIPTCASDAESPFKRLGFQLATGAGGGAVATLCCIAAGWWITAWRQRRTG